LQASDRVNLKSMLTMVSLEYLQASDRVNLKCIL